MRVRLLGHHVEVANLLTVLDEVTTLTDVSDPYTDLTRPGLVRVYAKAARLFPLSGGGR